ncbi:hypothetical protein TNCV_3527351 [Trichonephila clavipes]|nr:hypothetical protein TNCV_3527351 [Trichonephila clavipes]
MIRIFSVGKKPPPEYPDSEELDVGSSANLSSLRALVAEDLQVPFALADPAYPGPWAPPSTQWINRYSSGHSTGVALLL